MRSMDWILLNKLIIKFSSNVFGKIWPDMLNLKAKCLKEKTKNKEKEKKERQVYVKSKCILRK